jgi:uracil-DNA glycosylase
LTALREDASGCTACDLYARATQTVFGEGNPRAEVMLVGEQPGDREDTAGRPFVGPAGRLLDQALVEIGVDRGDIYVTNAVKHFKWRPRGKRRIHEAPNRTEQVACHRWLEAELEVVNPRLVVCLGRVAATAVLGRPITLAANRGQRIEHPAAEIVAVTVHPSSVLRLERQAREPAYQGFRDDLETYFGWLGGP